MAKRKKITCFECDQVCCKSAVIEIEGPRSLKDYSDMYFYLYHEGTQVVVVEYGRKWEWFIEYVTPCRNLVAGRCAIYENRPIVCRVYEAKYCEKNTKHPMVHLRTTDELCQYLLRIKKAHALKMLAKKHQVPDAVLAALPQAAPGNQAASAE